MASSGTDGEDTAEFFFVSSEQAEREERPDPLGMPPDSVVRAGRRFKLWRWELRATSGGRTRSRFIYRLLCRDAQVR
jgi:hypothetical protein